MSDTQKVSPRLKTHYETVVRPKLMEQFGYANPMQVPSLEKIVINMGVGGAVAQASLLEGAQRDLEQIAGQTPSAASVKLAMCSANCWGVRPLASAGGESICTTGCATRTFPRRRACVARRGARRRSGPAPG